MAVFMRVRLSFSGILYRMPAAHGDHGESSSLLGWALSIEWKEWARSGGQQNPERKL